MRLPPPRPRLPAIAITVAVHLLMLAAWQAARKPSVPSQERQTRHDLFWLLPSPAPKAAPPATQAPLTPARASAPPQMLPAPVLPASAEPEPPSQVAAPNLDASPAPASSLRADVLRAAGKADAAERQGKLAPLAGDTAMQRFGQAFAGARKGHWYEGAQITTLPDPSGRGNHIYKVQRGGAVYCVRILGNAPQAGRDVFQSLQSTTVVNCPRE